MWRVTLPCRGASSTSRRSGALRDVVERVRALGVWHDERRQQQQLLRSSNGHMTSHMALWSRCADPLRPCTDVDHDNNSSSGGVTAAAAATIHDNNSSDTTRDAHAESLRTLLATQHRVHAAMQTVANGTTIAAASYMVNVAHIEGVVADVCVGYAAPPQQHSQQQQQQQQQQQDDDGDSLAQLCSSHHDSTSNNDVDNKRSDGHGSRDAGVVCDNVALVDAWRAREPLLQVWLHVCEHDGDDGDGASTPTSRSPSHIVPLAVRCYVSPATLQSAATRAAGDRDKNNNNNECNDGGDQVAATLTTRSARAASTAASKADDDNNSNCGDALDAYARSLRTALLHRRVVFTGQLRGDVRYDAALRRVVCVPVLWLPYDGLSSSHHVLPAASSSSS